MKTQSREEMLEYWEKNGLIDPNCPGCQEYYESPKYPIDIFGPQHLASPGCESGKRNHCTCDKCF